MTPADAPQGQRELVSVLRDALAEYDAAHRDLMAYLNGPYVQGMSRIARERESEATEKFGNAAIPAVRTLLSRAPTQEEGEPADSDRDAEMFHRGWDAAKADNPVSLGTERVECPTWDASVDQIHRELAGEAEPPSTESPFCPTCGYRFCERVGGAEPCKGYNPNQCSMEPTPPSAEERHVRQIHEAHQVLDAMGVPVDTPTGDGGVRMLELPERLRAVTAPPSAEALVKAATAAMDAMQARCSYYQDLARPGHCTNGYDDCHCDTTRCYLLAALRTKGGTE